MKQAPRFCITAQPPRRFDRAGRVGLIGECAQALIRSELPSEESRLFVASALLAWLENGGSLEREYFQTTKAKSHRTASAIWRASSR